MDGLCIAGLGSQIAAYLAELYSKALLVLHLCVPRDCLRGGQCAPWGQSEMGKSA